MKRLCNCNPTAAPTTAAPDFSGGHRPFQFVRRGGWLGQVLGIYVSWQAGDSNVIAFDLPITRCPSGARTGAFLVLLRESFGYSSPSPQCGAPYQGPAPATL